MDNVLDIPNIRIITVSGRIAAGSTSLAKHLAETLGWKHIEGGDIFWEAVRKKMHLANKDTKLRPDEDDLLFEEKQKHILENEKHIVLESKLAGFCSQGMSDIFKVGVVCEDDHGQDQQTERIQRLLGREKTTLAEARAEVIEREQNDLAKWRRLYANNDEQWVYWEKNYYDLVVNTFFQTQEETLAIVLDTIGYKK